MISYSNGVMNKKYWIKNTKIKSLKNKIVQFYKKVKK